MFSRYASCVGNAPGHCSQTAADVELFADDVAVEPAAADFLGLQLDSAQVQIALYVQFVLLLCMVLFVLFLGYIYKAKSKSNKRARNVEVHENHYDTVKL